MAEGGGKLQFKKDSPVAMQLIEGLLFFTDDNSEPKKVNVDKFIGRNRADYPHERVDHSSGVTNIYGRPFQERDITVIRPHPETESSIGTAVQGEDGLIQSSPNVDTFIPTNIGKTGATLRGFSFNGNNDIVERGFYYGTASTQDELVNSGTKINASLSGNIFDVAVRSLTVNQKYYVFAYAKNGLGYGFGDVVEFTTHSSTIVAPSVTTKAATEIYSTTMIINGEATASGGDSISDQGFVYATQSEIDARSLTSVTAQDLGLINTRPINTNINPFSYQLNDLKSEEVLHYAAYVVNSNSTVYGDVLTATTLGKTVPTVNTRPAFNVLNTSAILLGEVLSNGGSTISQRGFRWSPTASTRDALVASGTEVLSSSSLSGPAFEAPITGLSDASQYWFVSWADNGQGRAYSNNVQSFTTQKTILLGPPTVSTSSPALVGTAGAQTSIRGYGNVLSENGASITERGLYIGTDSTQNGLLASGLKQSVDGTIGSYSYLFENLTRGETYYVMAYAVNDQGISFGNILSRTINLLGNEKVPLVYTYGVSRVDGEQVTETTATLLGNIGAGGDNTDAGTGVTEIGFLVSEDPNASFTVDGTATKHTVETSQTDNLLKDVTLELDSLTADTTYFFVCYGVNSHGAGYGAQRSFTTSSATVEYPRVATLPLISINATSAELRGALNSNGGAVVSKRGFYLIKKSDIAGSPTAAQIEADADKITSESTNLGGVEFRLVENGLDPDTAYWYVAFCENSTGKGFGGVSSFTTKSAVALPTVRTDSVENLTNNSVTLSGAITDNGGERTAPDDRGFYISETEISAAGLLANGIKVDSSSPAEILLSGTARNLVPGTTYHWMAFGTNSAGTANGAIKTFTIPGSSTKSVELDYDFLTFSSDGWLYLGEQEITATIVPANDQINVVASRWSDNSGYPAFNVNGNMITVYAPRRTNGYRVATLTVSLASSASTSAAITIEQWGNTHDEGIF